MNMRAEKLQKFEPSVQGKEQHKEKEEERESSVLSQAETVKQALQQDAPTVPLVLGPAPTEEQMKMLDEIVVPTEEADLEEINDDGTGKFVDLGSGFKIRVKRKSGYSTVYSVTARECHFSEVYEQLESGPVLDSEEDAKKIMQRMFVPRQQIITAIQNEPSWVEYRKRKVERLKHKIEKGDEKAQRIIDRQTEDSVVMEMLSLLSGCGSPNANSRNLRPLTNAGVLLRRFPLQCKRGQNNTNVFLTLHAIKHSDIIKRVIHKATGVDEDEVLRKLEERKKDRQQGS